MTTRSPGTSPVAPPRVLLLPVALLVHQLEEWFGGFPEWTQSVLPPGVSPERFVIINVIGFVLFGAGTLAARRAPSMTWFPTSFAALICLNGVLHLLATVVFGRYSPGVVTGLLLSVPAGTIVLRWAWTHLPRAQFTASVAAGVAIHALVSLVALS